jgi:prevent-host-death family protein
MSTTVSISEAQVRLPELVARAAADAEPCYIEQEGEAVAVLVSLREWQQRTRDASGEPRTDAEEQERRIRAYQQRMQHLGPEYWLTADQQARLRALIEKEELGEALTPAEEKERHRLLKRHEQLMVKRASAMQLRR